MTTALTRVGRAHARVGLLGNPSDGYGGRVLALSLPQLQATAHATPSDEWQLSSSELLAATIDAASTRAPDLVAQPAALTFETAIPRQVGLSGSTAIIIAALRALASMVNHTWEPVALAKLALEVETEVLGWTAGPQDRVVIAHEGLLDMDFATPWNAACYRALDQRALPPLFLAWFEQQGTASDVVHSDVRERWEAGDTNVRQVMHRFAELAADGRHALDADEAAERWPSLLREAFGLRRELWTIADSDERLVRTGEDLGAGVTFAGSGGAVVGAVRDRSALSAIRGAYESVDARFMEIA